MGQFTDRMMNFLNMLFDFRRRPVQIKSVISSFDDDFTDLVTQIPGSGAVLSGKGKDELHHEQRRYKVKRFYEGP